MAVAILSTLFPRLLVLSCDYVFLSIFGNNVLVCHSCGTHRWCCINYCLGRDKEMRQAIRRKCCRKKTAVREGSAAYMVYRINFDLSLAAVVSRRGCNHNGHCRCAVLAQTTNRRPWLEKEEVVVEEEEKMTLPKVTTHCWGLFSMPRCSLCDCLFISMALAGCALMTAVEWKCSLWAFLLHCHCPCCSDEPFESSFYSFHLNFAVCFIQFTCLTIGQFSIKPSLSWVLSYMLLLLCTQLHLE